MKKLVFAAALVAAFVPAVAGAQLVGGLRVGGSVPSRYYAEDVEMTQPFDGQLQLQLDLGWKVARQLSLGVYAGYGFVRPGEACPEDGDCSGNVLDLGVQAIWRFMPRPVSPWIGIGAGWEQARSEIEGEESTATGWDFLRLMVGLDVPVTDRFAIGPFAQLAIGQYSDFDLPAGGSPGKDTHTWFTLGLRGTWDDFVDHDGIAKAKAEADRLAAEKAAAAKAAAEAAAAAKAEADRLAAEKAAAEKAAAEAAAEAARLAADRDGDGVPNDADACPDEKGERSTDPKKHGCKGLVVVTEKGIELKETIQFETGKAVIRPVSTPVLKNVADVLKANPQIEKLSIEGHSDSVGNAEANTALSKRRAAAVVDWLVKKGGVDAARLTSTGYGPERPIADNATAEGRAKNRRVELLIVK